MANRDISLRLVPGEVHAVVGESGASGSTLMRILYGVQRADEGTSTVDGRPVCFARPSGAIAAGIGVVHQHLMLADDLTVLENVVLGAEPTRRGCLDRAAARRRLRELGERTASTWTRTRWSSTSASVGDRQRIEILAVLDRGNRVIVLDEPTAVLVPQEVDAAGPGSADIGVPLLGRGSPLGLALGALLGGGTRLLLGLAFLLWYLVVDEVPSQLVTFTPHLVTLLVLAVASQRLRPPAADGQPYRRGQQT